MKTVGERADPCPDRIPAQFIAVIPLKKPYLDVYALKKLTDHNGQISKGISVQQRSQ
jgi:hypothetical protein